MISSMEDKENETDLRPCLVDFKLGRNASGCRRDVSVPVGSELPMSELVVVGSVRWSRSGVRVICGTWSPG
jgi:hypothetical protein